MYCPLLSPSEESRIKKITVLVHKYIFQGNTACITVEYKICKEKFGLKKIGIQTSMWS